MTSMPPHIMLIDDDPLVREMVSEVLTEGGMDVVSFGDGFSAMKSLQEESAVPWDLVISDINMDGMDGFEVIRAVKEIQVRLPVVLMTANNSVDYAIKALRLGASNLFIKPLALRELVANIFHLVELHRDLRQAQENFKGLVEERRRFSYRSDELNVGALVHILTERLVDLGFASSSNQDVLAMAYHEALVNALEHGNLELDSTLKGGGFLLDDDFGDPFGEQRIDRLANPFYANRRVEVETLLTPEVYQIVITDEGKGFDVSKLGKLNEDSLERDCGRGLTMIRMVMDEVIHNAKGNQVTLVLRRKEAM